LLEELYKKLIEKSKNKEENTKKFFNNKVFKNGVKKELYTIDYSHRNYINKYFNYLVQKVMYLQIKNTDTKPIFLTLTLPSEYHYLKTNNKTKERIKNEKFKFDNVETSINEGSKLLYKLFRSFYHSLKTDRDTKAYFKELDYFGIMEYHKTYIPHFHSLIFIPLIENDENKTIEVIKRKWENFLKRNNLKSKTNKLEFLNGSKGGSLYVSKYLQKTLQNLENDEELYFYTGWKTLLNRLFYSSRVGLTKEQYLKIYYNLDEETKNEIMLKVKEKNTCLMYELEQITKIRTIQVNEKNERIKKTIKEPKDYKIFVYQKVEKTEKFDLDYYLYYLLENFKSVLKTQLVEFYKKDFRTEKLENCYLKDGTNVVKKIDKIIENEEEQIEKIIDKLLNKIYTYGWTDKDIYKKFVSYLYNKTNKLLQKYKITFEWYEEENEIAVEEYKNFMKELFNKIYIEKIYYEDFKSFKIVKYRTLHLKVFIKNNNNKFKKVYDKSKNEIMIFH